MNEINSLALLQAILGGSVTLAAISVTLVALVPVLLEIARVRIPDFLTGEEARRKLRLGLRLLGITVWIFGIATILSTVAFFCQTYILLISAVILFLVGLALLSYISYAVITLAVSLA
jgi:hypothetical protein